MKQLFSLLLAMFITIISCTTFAKSTVIQVNTLYIQPSTTSSISLKPYLSAQTIDEGYALAPSKTEYKHNDFFEMTIIFNDKLQQFIDSFKDGNNEAEEVANNNFQSAKHNSVNASKCKASS